MTAAHPLTAWPAVAGLPTTLPAHLSCERGVLGKEPGGDTDFHWIAATSAFSGLSGDLQRQLALGPEDVYRPTLLWHCDGELFQAVRCYPARSPDARGRTFLEKQVIEWRRSDGLPAAAAALVLLPYAAAVDDSIWSGREGDRDSFSEHLFISLTGDAIPRPALDPDALAATAAQGLAELRDQLGEDQLALLYARLLAGHRGIFLPQRIEPLGPAALAALMLPLPADISEQLSLIGWLPSSYSDADKLRRQWQLILGGAGLAHPAAASDPDPTAQQLDRAGDMARAVAQGSAAALSGSPRPVSPSQTAPTGGKAPLKLTVWGPSGSGKTVFLAQLYWSISDSSNCDWDIFPGDKGLDFFEQMLDRMNSGNAFPPPTQVGDKLDIICHLHNRSTGVEATLALVDRAGADYEGLHDDVREELLEADGIVLLLDPTRRDDRILQEITRTFDRMQLAAGRGIEKDPRPVAVCMTKADERIETPEDYRLATSDFDAFSRPYIEQNLLKHLDRRLSRTSLFPISAAGLHLRHGAIEPVVFYDESLNPRINSGSSFNLLAPIDWLIREIQ